MSKKQKIYLDHAATSYPKPASVIDAVVDYLKSAGNPGRGAHQYALVGARSIFDARQEIAQFLGIENDERLIFTPGCTASLNYVIKGLSGSIKSGDKVITSGLEHNSVTRPLQQLCKEPGLELVVMQLAHTEQEFLQELKGLFEGGSSQIKLCAFTNASNVTGQVLPVEKAAALAKEYSIPVLVDAAQTAGKLPANLSKTDISFWCASGHKGLLGPPGVGLLYVAPGQELEPLVVGGTGSGSESYEIPLDLPDRHEAGTAPGQNICGLAAGVQWIKDRNPEKLLQSELDLTRQFIEWSRQNDYIQVFGPTDFTSTPPYSRMPVLSFRIKDINPGDLAYMLDSAYSIAVRPGLHCAAQAHSSLATIETGLVRVSFGPENKQSDLEHLCSSLDEILSRGAKKVLEECR